MLRLTFILILQIFAFHVALAQDAPAFATDDCYTNNNSLEKQAGVIAATAENAACIQTVQDNKCEEFKNSLPADEQHKVLTCSSADSMGVGTLLLSCGAGVSDFVVDTVTGAVYLISQLPHLPGAIWRGLNEAGAALNKCNGDVDIRRSLFATVAPLYPEDQGKSYIEDLSIPCDSLVMVANNQANAALLEISRKKKKQEEIQSMRANGMKLPADVDQRFGVTPGEEEFMKRYMAANDAINASTNKAFGEIWKQVSTQLACYNTAAKVEATCSIVADVASGVLTGGALQLVSKSAKVQKIMSGIAGKMKAEDIVATSAVAGEKTAGAGGRSSRLVMSEEERARELAKTSVMDKGQRVSYAEDVLNRPLTEKQKNAIWEAHTLGRESLAASGKYSTDDLARKYRHLKQNGFSDAEVDQLMRRGITGETAPDKFSFGGDFNLGEQTAKDVLDRAGVKTGYDSSWTQKTMNKLSGPEAQKVSDALTSKGYAAARERDMLASQRYFKDAYSINIGIAEAALKDGRESVVEAYMTRSFAFKNAYSGASRVREVSSADDIIKHAVSTKYFDKIEKRGFESVYDPSLKENLNVYDYRSIKFHRKSPEEVYLANNRQLQELLAIKAIGNEMPYNLPPGTPGYLRSLSPSKVGEYIQIYKKNMELIENEYFKPK